MRKPIIASLAVLGLIAAPAMAATSHKAKPAAHKTVKKADKTAAATKTK